MASFTVSNLFDSGAGSLRQAILDTNALPGADIIDFAPDLSGTINLTSGELLITDSLTLNGPGFELLTIDAQQLSRVFDINTDFTSEAVTLSGLTITGGATQGNFENGGGIRNQGNLTVSNSIISGNSTSGYLGDGGGIGSTGSLTISKSTISDNSVNEASGGGIFSFGDLTVSNSTISGNSTSGEMSYGGGIQLVGSQASISNSTISGNSTSGFGSNGGGIYNYAGSLTLSNSTVSGNSSSSSGGGIFTPSFSELTLNSSIVAENTAVYSGVDIRSNFSGAEPISGSNNLIGSGDGNSFVNDADGNLVGTDDTPLDPLLGPLIDNGGPTQTQALLPGSPAINTGANPLNLLTDQRGSIFARSIGQADIGAFEVQSGARSTSPQAVPEPTSLISLALTAIILSRHLLKRSTKDCT